MRLGRIVGRIGHIYPIKRIRIGHIYPLRRAGVCLGHKDKTEDKEPTR